MRNEQEAKIQAAMQSFQRAMADLDIEYILLMQRCGCKNFRMWRL